MTAPHEVTIAEHTVYDALCITCPWTTEGHTDRSWRDHLAEQHERTAHKAEEGGTDAESPFRMPEDRCQEHGTVRPCRHCRETEEGA